MHDVFDKIKIIFELHKTGAILGHETAEFSVTSHYRIPKTNEIFKFDGLLYRIENVEMGYSASSTDDVLLLTYKVKANQLSDSGA